MKRFFIVFFLTIISFNVCSDTIFGQWQGDIYFSDERKETSRVEVEFMEETVIFHYTSGESAEFEYYFETYEGFDLIFINEAGYYYEFVNDNLFRLEPAFGSEVAEIVFYRGETSR